MTAATAPARPAHEDDQSIRLTFAHLVRAEWIKLWSLRSTYWTLGVTVVVMVGFALIMALNAQAVNEDFGPGGDLVIDGVTVATFGYYFGQISVAVLGAIIVTGEYSTGMIRSTMTAAPGRLNALGAKAAVLAVVTFATGVVGVFASYLATLAMLSPFDGQADLAEPSTWRALLGAGLYLAAIALLSFGIGTLLKSSAGAIAAVLGILLLLPTVVSIGGFWLDWVADIGPFLPDAAGGRIMAPPQEVAPEFGGPDEGTTVLSPWQGFGLLSAYVAAVLAFAAVVVKRRDV